MLPSLNPLEDCIYLDDGPGIFCTKQLNQCNDCPMVGSNYCHECPIVMKGKVCIRTVPNSKECGFYEQWKPGSN